MTPTLKRQMSSLPLVSQETWGTSYDKIKKKNRFNKRNNSFARSMHLGRGDGGGEVDGSS